MDIDDALGLLTGPHFSIVNGCIYRKDRNRTPTGDECEAIDVLCDDWDYAWYPDDPGPYAPVDFGLVAREPEG